MLGLEAQRAKSDADAYTDQRQNEDDDDEDDYGDDGDNKRFDPAAVKEVLNQRQPNHEHNQCSDYSADQPVHDWADNYAQ